MAQEGKTSEDAGGDDGGPFGVLHRVDRALYFGERFIVVTFLICIAVTMFVDVAYGRLVAQDSKVGKVLAKLAGIEDMETRTWIDQTIAPWLALGLGVALIWFGFWTAERHKGAPFLKVKQSALAMTAITSAVLAGTGWLMMQMESVQFYLLVYVGASALYVARATGASDRSGGRRRSARCCSWSPRCTRG